MMKKLLPLLFLLLTNPLRAEPELPEDYMYLCKVMAQNMKSSDFGVYKLKILQVNAEAKGGGQGKEKELILASPEIKPGDIIAIRNFKLKTIALHRLEYYQDDALQDLISVSQKACLAESEQEALKLFLKEGERWVFSGVKVDVNKDALTKEWRGTTSLYLAEHLIL